MTIPNHKPWAWMMLLTLMLTGQRADAIWVTFRLNMNGLSGFTTPEVNGTFNGWCGTCNALSDPDGDGIWETTINLPQGVIEYKFSFDNWAGQENLVSSGCATAGNNRLLNVQSDMVLDVVCWGLCENCIESDDGIWSLSWSEEFLGNSLNLNTWTHELGNHGWGNNEWQNYTNSASNLQVSAGSLKIIARHHGGNNYTSARIITNDKFEFQYGKIEARIKVPIGQGIWPAFWMMGANYETVGWPQCGEIDIMEHINNEPLTHAAIHWNNGGHTYETSNVPFQKNEFHKYGAIWNEDGVTYTLNDHPFYYFPFQSHNNTAQIFQKPFFFLLNVAVGGNWPGYPDGTATFPATMEVQYIRVYELNTTGLSTDKETMVSRVYPVPCGDYLHLELSTGRAVSRVVVYSSTGGVVGIYPVVGDGLTLDTSPWSPGTYMVQVWGGNGALENHRVVKM